jgi:hypothetical protein
MTDPQDDVPCTACGAEGPRSRLDDDGLCPDCRTPAGRLVAALIARGLSPITNSCGNVLVKGHDFVCEPGKDGDPWVISDDGTEAAADAIAAIVDYPALLVDRNRLLGEEIAAAGRLRDVTAERDTLAARVAELEAENMRLRAGWALSLIHI